MGTSVAHTCATMEHVWISSKTTSAAVRTDTRADTVTIVSVEQKHACDSLNRSQTQTSQVTASRLSKTTNSQGTIPKGQITAAQTMVLEIKTGFLGLSFLSC